MNFTSFLFLKNFCTFFEKNLKNSLQNFCKFEIYTLILDHVKSLLVT